MSNLDFIGQIASTGLMGIVAAGAILLARSLYNELKEERAARLVDQKNHADEMEAEKDLRIADAEKTNAIQIAMQERVTNAVSKIYDLYELLRRGRGEPRDTDRPSTRSGGRRD